VNGALVHFEDDLPFARAHGAPRGGGLEIHRPGEIAKLADPGNVVASGCGAPRFSRFDLPVAVLAALPASAPGAKRRRSAAGDPVLPYAVNGNPSDRLHL
jgi:hypothetical protein